MRIAELDSEVLEARLGQLLGEERNVQLAFLLHLEEFDRRGLYEEKGYATLWVYCRREFRLLDGAIYRRIHAMQIVRNFPQVIDYLHDGRLFMMTLVLLKDVLTPENATGLFERTSRMSKDDVTSLVASMKPPQPVPPTKITKVPPKLVESVAAPSLFSAPAAARTSDVLSQVPSASEPSPVPEEWTMVRMTVSREFMAAFEEAKVILGHSIPDGKFESILKRGLDLIIEKAGKRNGVLPVRGRKKKNEMKSPATAATTAAPETDTTGSAKRVVIPADVRREIWTRDCGRCAWAMPGGAVCGSRRQLEVDHIVPFAKGGPTVATNLRLCCRDHNSLHARREYGAPWMEQFRKKSRLPPVKV